MRVRLSSGLWTWIAALLVLGLASIHLAYYFPRAIDDMYIYLRYASNLASGDGFTYNAGERVEGFSSPVWLGLLGFGEILGLGGVSFAKFLSAVSFAGLLAGIWWFGHERLGLSRPLAWLAVGFATTNSYLVSWSTYGLETPAYLALMIWSAVLLGRVLEARPNAVPWACVVLGLFALSRPEAPFFLALLAGGSFMLPPAPEAWLTRLRRLLIPVGASVLAYGSWVLFRRWYFGLWFPHTYYAKLGSALSWDNLMPILAEGSSFPELILLGGGLLLAIWMLVSARNPVVLLVVLGSCYFAAGVAVDWMPNARHFLPMWLFLPFGWILLAERLGHARHRVVKVVGVVIPVLVLGLCAAFLVQIDSRYSRFDFASHGRGVDWVLTKSKLKVQDSLDCLRKRNPSHVSKHDYFNHGMITQLYRLIDADARPLEETWYIGRDIGRVGFLAPVRVFETDGLFTPDVVRNVHWQQSKSPDSALIRAAFDRPVAMTEFPDKWDTAARGDRDIMKRYGPYSGGDYVHLAALDRTAPTYLERMKRYEAALSRMPTAYYTMTLYGEAVGALLDRRVNHVRWFESPAAAESECVD